MTTFSLVINMDNAAFDGDHVELAIRLQQINHTLLFRPHLTSGAIHDSNGNRCGHWSIYEDAPTQPPTGGST